MTTLKAEYNGIVLVVTGQGMTWHFYILDSDVVGGKSRGLGFTDIDAVKVAAVTSADLYLVFNCVN